MKRFIIYKLGMIGASLLVLSALFPPALKRSYVTLQSAKYAIPNGYGFLFDLADRGSTGKKGQYAVGYEVNWDVLALEWVAIIFIFAAIVAWKLKNVEK